MTNSPQTPQFQEIPTISQHTNHHKFQAIRKVRNAPIQGEFTKLVFSNFEKPGKNLSRDALESSFPDVATRPARVLNFDKKQRFQNT